MKLTLEIHEDHAPALLELLATLAARKTKRSEALAKFIAGEGDESSEVAGGADLPMNPPEPLTAAPELPMPTDLPDLPPLPEGKLRWAYLGTFPEEDLETSESIQFPTREIRWLSENMGWLACWSLNGPFHHIEAI
jgi:hypothetical protein